MAEDGFNLPVCACVGVVVRPDARIVFSLSSAAEAAPAEALFENITWALSSDWCQTAAEPAPLLAAFSFSLSLYLCADRYRNSRPKDCFGDFGCGFCYVAQINIFIKVF